MIPVIASLNGSTPGGWTSFARQIEQAGADALELNLYSVPTDMNLAGADLEQTYIEVFKAVKAAVTIPVREAQPVLHKLRERGQAFRRTRSQRTRALQPLLSTGH